MYTAYRRVPSYVRWYFAWELQQSFEWALENAVAIYGGPNISLRVQLSLSRAMFKKFSPIAIYVRWGEFQHRCNAVQWRSSAHTFCIVYIFWSCLKSLDGGG